MSLIIHARLNGKGMHACGVKNPRRSIGQISFWRYRSEDRCWKCTKALKAASAEPQPGDGNG